MITIFKKKFLFIIFQCQVEILLQSHFLVCPNTIDDSDLVKDKLIDLRPERIGILKFSNKCLIELFGVL